MQLIAQNAWLVALFPLLAAFLIFMAASVNREANRLAISLSLLGTGFSFLWSLGLLSSRIFNPDILMQGHMRWLTAGTFEFQIGWAVDNLTALMLGIVTFISCIGYY